MANGAVGAENSERAGRREMWRDRIVRISIAATVALAGAVVVGHVLGVPRLISIYPNGRSTATSTALCFLVLAVATVFGWYGRAKPWTRWTGNVLAAAVVVFALAFISFGSKSGAPVSGSATRVPGEPVRELAASETQATMALTTAIGLSLLGAAAVLSRRKTEVIAQVLVLGAAALALTSGIGYALGSPWVYEGLPAFTGMGLPTVLMFLSLSTAILAANTDTGIVATISSSEFGGILARRMLPISIAAPILIGWLRVKGQDLDLYGTSYGLSLMVAALIVTLSTTILISAHRLNILDRKRAASDEEAANRAERINELLETAAEGIISFGDDRRITLINPSAVRMFARTDATGLDINELIRSGLEAIDNFGANGDRSGTLKDVQMVGETSAGRLFPIEGSVVKRRADKRHGAYTLIFRDVSERVKAENKIRALNERLEEQVRRRTEQLNRATNDLEAFSYSVSHDLRAPLRAMSGFARIITDDYGEGLAPAALHYLERIEANAAHMSELIDGLLDFAKMDRVAATRQHLDMAGIVTDEISLLSSSLEGRRAAFHVGDLPVCDADPLLLRRVIANLISNAVKFTGDCDAPEIEIGYDDDLNAYYVRDNGIGFDPARADRLFEVFQRLHSREKYGGAGIGLALSRRIIEKHGGEIWAESRPRQGAVFYFTVAERAPVLPRLASSS